MSNTNSIDVWHLGSELVAPLEEAPSSAQQGGGSDETNLPPQGRSTQSVQADAGVNVEQATAGLS